ncbi:MAG: DUF835 domain-containing protein [Thermoplasmata archaeon]|nr:DUF835 domain-containing protein [Thermoplasmata archaeon]
MALGSSSALPTGFEPRSGNVYLVEERRPKVTFDLFDQALSSGFSGLVVTRDFPKRLLSEKELGTCKVVWLTNMVGEGRINPTAIGIIMGQVRAFIEANPKSVVLLDGLEYLISLNTYDRMLQFMHQLRDVVVTNECVMLVPIDPRTVGQRELALLERSMEPLIPRTEAEPSEESILGTEDQGVLRLLDARPR